MLLFVILVFNIGERDGGFVLILREYRLLRLRRQISRNKNVDGSKQRRKDEQHVPSTASVIFLLICFMLRPPLSAVGSRSPRRFQ